MHPLVKLAIRSVEHFIETGKSLPCPAHLPDFLRQSAGTFISIKKQGCLRGDTPHPRLAVSVPGGGNCVPSGPDLRRVHGLVPARPTVAARSLATRLWPGALLLGLMIHELSAPPATARCRNPQAA